MEPILEKDARSRHARESLKMRVDWYVSLLQSCTEGHAVDLCVCYWCCAFRDLGSKVA